jgi:hypothetical protein
MRTTDSNYLDAIPGRLCATMHIAKRLLKIRTGRQLAAMLAER